VTLARIGFIVVVAQNLACADHLRHREGRGRSRPPKQKDKGMRLSAVIGTVIGLIGLASLATAATDYPTRTVEIVVPFPPGGNTDLLARILADNLQTGFKQPVVVVNRPGAGTNIGAAFVANSKPDGYIALISAPAALVVNQFLYSNLQYDPDTSFSPVSLVGRFPNVLVVHPSVGVKTVQELIDKAKARPGQINFASAGIGSTSHLAGMLFAEMAGIDVVHVPYKGTSESLQDLIAGRVAYTIDNLGPILPFIQSGQLIALGISSKDPATLLPGVPPIGSVLNGYQLSSWNVLAVPASTPKDIVANLSVESDRVLHLPNVVERARSFGSETVGGTPEEVAAFLRDERVRWESAIKAAKLGKDTFK
jgi:tripartite-type tricarboxylate transporter receptor subunit TctC